MDAARRAGMKLARSTDAASTHTTEIAVPASRGLTAKSMLRRRRVAANEQRMPPTIPQPRWLVIRQRLDQGFIDKGKDGSTGADAQREDDHRGEREARMLTQLAHRKTKILQESLHGKSFPRPALFGLHRIIGAIIIRQYVIRIHFH
jgi:hypothetical protein